MPDLNPLPAALSAPRRLLGLYQLFGRWPWLLRALRLAAWSLFGAWLLFAALVLGLRYLVLPQVENYRPEIEQAAARATGLQVHIERIEASWDALNPHLALSGVRLADAQGRTAFALDRVDAVLSWQTLWHGQAMLSLLAVDGPVLHIRRDQNGRLSVAGIDAEGETDPRIAEWLLAQAHIQIRHASVIWEDAMRQAPPLRLDDLAFTLNNHGKRHAFGLTATPPSALASKLDLRGELIGHPELRETFEALRQSVDAHLFLEVDYADLAGWHTWLDYPIHLPQGRGALRVWADWDGRRNQTARLTADVALEDVRTRLGHAVPELALNTMRGRLSGHWGEDGPRTFWSLGGQRIELLTLDGLRLPPTDFRLDWQQNDTQTQGKATASDLDLALLQRLADYLPLDTTSRQWLERHQPQGHLTELRSSWESGPSNGEEAPSLRRYALRSRFIELGLQAAGAIPGFSGLSGELEADEQSGSAQLETRHGALDLPNIFPERRIALDSLRAKIGWRRDGQTVDARLDRLEFSNADAAGTARGTYLWNGQGPGQIDLSASLSRADARAVWRYMPQVVNNDTRQWLQRGIVGGQPGETRLVLKGDLRDFPFRDKAKGQFLVTTRVQGGKIDYAPGWPGIEDIDAELSFGVGMQIVASKGRILGTQLSQVNVSIPDFESPEEMLLIRGQVNGPTSEFLKFIEQSPVSRKIDNFTDEMRASGNGRLDLNIDMNLRRILEAKVRGEYQFINNQVHAVPGLPPLTQVNGRLKITEASVSAQEISAQILGGPMKLSVRNEGDRVNVLLGGTANMAEARKLLPLPMLEQVTGKSAWKGEIKVRKKNADFLIESGLNGVSSSLPEPFNKSAGTALPLRIEKGTPPDPGKSGQIRDQWRITLGKVAEALLIRRREGEEMLLERGAVAVGEALPKLPERGIAININQPRIDADTWKRLLPESNAASGKGAGLSVVSLKTPSLRLQGRDFNQVELSARPRDNGWQMALNTREAQGDVFWRGAGDGWVQANLKRLLLPNASQTLEGEQLINSLPGMDIRVDDFALGDKRLGKLELKARNERGTWQLDTLSISNPDGNLKGKARWNNQGSHHTRLTFDLQATDTGKLLDRLGYPGTLKAGSSSLKGDLTWDGPLTNIHYPSLSGDLSVNTGKGQFAKVEPGIGKLLGLLSLQSLPRRLTLDFRDIFSEGFAFDSIDGQMNVKAGIMRTSRDLRIDGPAARILMRGDTDLKAETQNLLVTVQPEVSTVFSVGALLLAHPAIAAATVVANKVLQNPLNKAFSFQYRVTGTWDDPKAEKIGQSSRDVREPTPPEAPETGKTEEKTS